MKTYLKILTMCALIVSCQENKKETYNITSAVQKEQSAQEKRDKNTRDLPSNTTLTKAQFKDYFPKQLGAYKLLNVSVLLSNALASALYVKDNNYGTSITYSLEDGNRKGSAILQNFKDAYKLQHNGPEGTTYIFNERDGYKTIAFLQPKIKRNDIRFIYGNRFRITLEGPADVETLWSYLQTDNLKKLDNY